MCVDATRRPGRVPDGVRTCTGDTSGTGIASWSDTQHFLSSGRGAQANQWRVVHAKGVEAIVAGMRALRGHAMVQLSALLAFIPLALENTMLQVRARGRTHPGA